MEKKMIEAGAIFDRVCGKYISARREEDESCMGRRCIRIQAREMDFRDRRVSIQCRSRICHGKQRAMVQMKIVAVEILQNYDIKVANGQKFEPDTSLILKMKHGFKVKINKRCSS
ncbi:Cytochrome P450 [Arabidopsis thaliana x Arabidopsis arenosa]|uniref:Cytochrome P450 n=1 Tax=Arabidopsis thaliana x Arabidopsis arenosa TaxID=1240361 RepID=A0A8T2D2G5_9BRAS|nr:Cytochrome P450 [Arabidopsis thaliana x Arabidopsis arenosa]